MLAGLNMDNPEDAAAHVEHIRSIINEDLLSEIAERNERIVTDIPTQLDELELLVTTNQVRGAILNQIKSINNLLAEAISV